MQTPERIFHTKAITKVYRTGEVEVHALRGVDAELFAGEFTVLLGASGSGKSTLLNILGGLDSATSGQAWFRESELTAMSERQLTKWWSPEGEEGTLRDQAIKRRIYPKEFAQMVLFLAADDGAACTAQQFLVDGGRF